MLAYLTAISIFNIFLGYALAVYLLRARETAELGQRTTETMRRSGRSSASSSREENSPASTVDGSSLFQESSLNRQTTPTHSATTSKSVPSDDVGRQASDEADAQLLAGIADFRTQLEKLRSDTVMEGISQDSFVGRE